MFFSNLCPQYHKWSMQIIFDNILIYKYHQELQFGQDVRRMYIYLNESFIFFFLFQVIFCLRIGGERNNKENLLKCQWEDAQLENMDIPTVITVVSFKLITPLYVLAHSICSILLFNEYCVWSVGWGF